MLSIWLRFHDVWFTMPCSKQWVLDENYMAVATCTGYSSRVNESLFVCIVSKRILMRGINIKKSHASLNIFYFLHIVLSFVKILDWKFCLFWQMKYKYMFELILLFYRSFVIWVWSLYWNFIYRKKILYGIWLSEI